MDRFNRSEPTDWGHRLRTQTEDTEQFLREIAIGFERSQIFLTAFELKIFTKLKSPKTSKNLIQEMGAAPGNNCSLPRCFNGNETALQKRRILSDSSRTDTFSRWRGTLFFTLSGIRMQRTRNL